jgi:hypothetical protein
VPEKCRKLPRAAALAGKSPLKVHRGAASVCGRLAHFGSALNRALTILFAIA